MNNKIKNYISGNITAESNEYIPIYDPSTGEQIYEVVLSNQNDLQAAIRSAKVAFNEWSNITPLKRSRVLSKYK